MALKKTYRVVAWMCGGSFRDERARGVSKTEAIKLTEQLRVEGHKDADWISERHAQAVECAP